MARALIGIARVLSILAAVNLTVLLFMGGRADTREELAIVVALDVLVGLLYAIAIMSWPRPLSDTRRIGTRLLLAATVWIVVSGALASLHLYFDWARRNADRFAPAALDGQPSCIQYSESNPHTALASSRGGSSPPGRQACRSIESSPSMAVA